MFDILPFLEALAPDSATSATTIAGILRERGWFGSAQRIEWAGEVVRTRQIPNPPPDLPADQVTDAETFLAGLLPPGWFKIVMSSPFRSGWTGRTYGPKEGTHKSGDWFIQYGMDLGVAEGTDVLAAFAGHVTKFLPHTPSSDTS